MNEPPPRRRGSKRLLRLVCEAQPAEPSAARHDDDLLTEDSLALTVAETWAGRWIYVPAFGHWFAWRKSRWAQDRKLRHFDEARKLLRSIVGLRKDLQPKVVTRLLRASTVRAVLELARTDERLVVGEDELDRDPMLLGTPAGVVDLRTGELRPARKDDLITKSTRVPPAPPGTEAPLFMHFLRRIFAHDQEIIPFLRRWLGYCLTGSIEEHRFAFGHGSGGNGKGTLLNTTTRLLGDYAAVAPSDLLLASNSERHPTDLAMLRGARFVTAQELAAGRLWDEPKLKQLTGGDPVTARFMRKDFFTYQPQFKLFVAANHFPGFKSVDDAIRRRLILIPFLQHIPEHERDKKLEKRLLDEEGPAMLR